MTKNLEILEQLQELDLRLERIRNFVDHFQDFLNEIDEEKALVKKRAELEKALLDELKKSKTRKELDLKAGEEHLAKCNARLYTVKTDKEYQATLKEIEEQKQKNSDLETEILLLYDQIEQEENRLKEIRKNFDQEEQQFEERKKDLQKKLEKAKNLLPQLEKERENTISSVPKDILDNYLWIQQRLGTKTCTRVIDKICQTCFRVIPSQMYNEVLTKEKILTCPGCNRILVYRETEFLPESEDEF